MFERRPTGFGTIVNGVYFRPHKEPKGPPIYCPKDVWVKESKLKNGGIKPTCVARPPVIVSQGFVLPLPKREKAPQLYCPQDPWTRPSFNRLLNRNAQNRQEFQKDFSKPAGINSLSKKKKQRLNVTKRRQSHLPPPDQINRNNNPFNEPVPEEEEEEGVEHVIEPPNETHPEEGDIYNDDINHNNNNNSNNIKENSNENEFGDTQTSVAKEPLEVALPLSPTPLSDSEDNNNQINKMEEDNKKEEVEQPKEQEEIKAEVKPDDEEVEVEEEEGEEEVEEEEVEEEVEKVGGGEEEEEVEEEEVEEKEVEEEEVEVEKEVEEKEVEEEEVEVEKVGGGEEVEVEKVGGGEEEEEVEEVEKVEEEEEVEEEEPKKEEPKKEEKPKKNEVKKEKVKKEEVKKVQPKKVENTPKTKTSNLLVPVKSNKPLKATEPAPTVSVETKTEEKLPSQVKKQSNSRRQTPKVKRGNSSNILNETTDSLGSFDPDFELSDDDDSLFDTPVHPAVRQLRKSGGRSKTPKMSNVIDSESSTPISIKSKAVADSDDLGLDDDMLSELSEGELDENVKLSDDDDDDF